MKLINKLKISIFLVAMLVFSSGFVGWSSSAVSSGFENPFGMFNARSDFKNARDAKTDFLRFTGNWQNFEPTKGNYDYSYFDKGVSVSQKANLQMVITISPVSNWGGSVDAHSQTPAGSTLYFDGFPRDPQAWAAFMKKTVERYDGDGYQDMPGLTKPIKYWQVDNEWIWLWLDSTESFVQFTKITYNAIKQADPNAKVITGAFTHLSGPALVDGYLPDRTSIEVGSSDASRTTYTRDELTQYPPMYELIEKIDYFAANAQGYYDYVDMHAYTSDPYILEGQIKWLRDRFIAAGDDSVEMMSTENAGPWFDYTTVEHSRQVVTRTMISFDSGVKMFAWSSLMPIIGANDNYTRLALEDSNKVKRPAYYTYQVMAGKLDGLLTLERLDMNDPDVYVYKAVTAQKTIYVMWHRGAGTSVVLPYQGNQALLTNIITANGQTVPTTQQIAPVNGQLTVNLTASPVFVE